MVGGHGTGRDEDRDGRKRAEESFRSIASARGGTRYEARAVREKVTAAAGRPCVCFLNRLVTSSLLLSNYDTNGIKWLKIRQAACCHTSLIPSLVDYGSSQ